MITKKLMTHFYKEVVEGVACGVALARAQRKIKEEHPHVFSWGAFICQGKHGPLDS